MSGKKYDFSKFFAMMMALFAGVFVVSSTASMMAHSQGAVMSMSMIQWGGLSVLSITLGMALVTLKWGLKINGLNETPQIS